MQMASKPMVPYPSISPSHHLVAKPQYSAPVRPQDQPRLTSDQPCLSSRHQDQPRLTSLPVCIFSPHPPPPSLSLSLDPLQYARHKIRHLRLQHLALTRLQLSHVSEWHGIIGASLDCSIGSRTLTASVIRFGFACSVLSLSLFLFLCLSLCLCLCAGTVSRVPKRGDFRLATKPTRDCRGQR